MVYLTQAYGCPPPHLTIWQFPDDCYRTDTFQFSKEIASHHCITKKHIIITKEKALRPGADHSLLSGKLNENVTLKAPHVKCFFWSTSSLMQVYLSAFLTEMLWPRSILVCVVKVWTTAKQEVTMTTRWAIICRRGRDCSNDTITLSSGYKASIQGIVCDFWCNCHR